MQRGSTNPRPHTRSQAPPPEPAPLSGWRAPRLLRGTCRAGRGAALLPVRAPLCGPLLLPLLRLLGLRGASRRCADAEARGDRLEQGSRGHRRSHVAVGAAAAGLAAPGCAAAPDRALGSSERPSSRCNPQPTAGAAAAEAQRELGPRTRGPGLEAAGGAGRQSGAPQAQVSWDRGAGPLGGGVCPGEGSRARPTRARRSGRDWTLMARRPLSW